MRKRADEQDVRRFLEEFARHASASTTCYLSGGATAVLHGWRTSTIDIDIRLEPEDDGLLRALPRLKDELQLNVEAASPADFIPLPDGWRERSIVIATIGRLHVRHFDLYSQALAKAIRGHDVDRLDVNAMLEHGYIDRTTLLGFFDLIEPQLYRFPGLDPARARRNVGALTKELRIDGPGRSIDL